MKVSTRTRYGVRFLFRLALNYQNGSLQLSEIAKLERISEKYLSQIVIPLKAGGVIDAIRGAQGGYLLTDAPEKINLKRVVQILEGTICPVKCIEKQDCDRTSKCVAQRLWKKLYKSIDETLSAITLADLVEWYVADGEKMNFEI